MDASQSPVTLLPSAAPSACLDPADYQPQTLLARQLYAQRRRRTKAFGDLAEHFSEPAWDILLDLFVAWGEGKKVSVSSACAAACVPPTTGLRWIRFLKQSGLILEREDATDRRRRHVHLTPETFHKLLAYLSWLD